MFLFLLGLLILIGGYFTYGKFITTLFGPDNRQPPSIKHHDNVDFIVLPHWKNMLIQLLNIAGIGPVIGLIIGIRFGELVFIILPLGNILAGAVHDYFSGMISMRHNGQNLPATLKIYLGNATYCLFSIFLSIVLLLVVAVFINIP
ncbi:MAG: carbon starvation CstA family protein, partial [Lentisphaeria bacterium]